MRRVFVALLCGALLAIPAGIAVGVGQEEEVGSVPASECPEAAQAREDAGLPPVDFFSPGCPDPATIQAEPEIDVLERDAACEEHYSDDPTWCPTPAEVSEAEAAASTGGSE